MIPNLVPKPQFGNQKAVNYLPASYILFGYFAYDLGVISMASLIAGNIWRADSSPISINVLA